MPITTQNFVPQSGQLTAYLFENPRTGLARNLFWNIDFDFHPFEYEVEQEDPNCLVDWLTLPKDCDLWSSPTAFSKVIQSNAEVSCYLEGRHIDATEWVFELRPAEDGLTWHLDYALSLASETLELTAGKHLELSGRTQLTFRGLMIGKESLTPKVTSEQDARRALAPFFDACAYDCCDEGRYFLLRRRAVGPSG